MAIDFTPHKYQHLIMGAIHATKRLAVWAGMGLGKTPSTATALEDLSLTEDVYPVLVIAPLRVARTTWPQEYQKWNHLKHRRVVTICGALKERQAALRMKGDVFTANLAEAEDDGELLEFEGPDGSEKEVVARFAQFRNWFAPIRLTPEAVHLSNRYAWSVKLDNGMTVELGREQGDALLKERISRLVSVYPQLLERLQGKIENVDMRYPNGLALKADGLVLAALNGKKK